MGRTQLFKRLVPVVAVAAAAWLGYGELDQRGAGKQAAPAHSNQLLAEAYEQRRSGVQVAGEGLVAKVLPDDNKGSRHQRFIIELNTGQSVLVAHNIDLAPRIDGLRTGDRVEFYGQYEWNERGGVLHWTHHDPAGRHAGGWLRHAGKTYE